MQTTIPHALIDVRVREIVNEHGRLARPLSSLDDGASLTAAGMSSLASVDVLLALESEFGEFPERMLNGKVFYSIHSIAVALRALLQR